MKPYLLSKLSKILSAELVGDREQIVDNIQIDSRHIFQSKNALFIAFKGVQFDGHNFIKQAYEKGIRNFMVVHLPKEKMGGANYVIVEDCRAALQNWAKYHVGKMNVPIIGITGSNGKTIIKEWLYQLLLNDFRVVRSPKSYNSQIGVPLSALEIVETDEWALIELGISEPNEMQVIADIVEPHIGVLSNIGTAHSAFFPDRQTHIREKIRLFKSSEIIIYPYDDLETREIIQKQYADRRLVGFGKKEGADIRLFNLNDNTEEITYKGETYEIKIPSRDEATIQNALICFSVLTQLDVNLPSAIAAFAQLSAIEMRLELKEGDNNCVIINDTFNADLSSVPIALNVLNEQTLSKKTLILTDILQNRIQGKELYHQLAQWVNAYPIQRVYLIGTEITRYSPLFKSVKGSFSTTTEFLNFIDRGFFYDEAILLKGARKFKLEKIATALERKSHDTTLEVNLNNLIDNVNYFKSKLAHDTLLMCMVKAFGYGTGGFEVAQTLVGHVDYLGVAYADEGADLRRKGIQLPIMVMNPEQNSFDTIIEYNLEAEIYSLRVLERFTLKLIEKEISQSFPIHIKLNTGMNRLGFKPSDIKELVRQLADNPYVKVKSIFTHLATSDMENEAAFVHEQVAKFNSMYDKLTFNLGYRPIRHILNSAGISNFPEYQMEMVRLGIGMYGIAANQEADKYLKNVVTFKTVISQITTLSSGDSVSYGRNFVADKPMRIATLPVGYADGVKRNLSNKVGKVNIGGHLAPILGNVCMDMIMVDVTEIDCSEGDDVIIFGENPSLRDIAHDANTISYEILTSISSRVKRIYIQ